jgi:Uma2 family endonuclease
MAGKTLSKNGLTVGDWLQLPEGPPCYELEHGRLVKMPSPRREHQEIVGLLFVALRQFAREHDLGTVVMAVDVALPTGQGYIPDITFVRREREAALLGRDGKVHGAPDLVVEVLSPSTRLRDRYRKLRAYWEAGVMWYWLVDSEALGVEEFQHTPQGYLAATLAAPGEIFETKALPGLRLDLAALVGETRPMQPRRRRKR